MTNSFLLRTVATFNQWGQLLIGPNGVDAQSKLRTNSATDDSSSGVLKIMSDFLAGMAVKFDNKLRLFQSYSIKWTSESDKAIYRVNGRLNKILLLIYNMGFYMHSKYYIMIELLLGCNVPV